MSVETSTEYEVLGKGRKLAEGLEKVTGRARYAGDMQLPGMLHARPVLSMYAHARVLSVDSSAARAVPGVVAVLLADDLPTRERAINSRHSAVLARERVLFRGQPVAVVVATSEAAAQDGADAVLVAYEELPVAVDSLAAAAPDAPVIWPEGLPKEGVDLTAAHAAVEHAEAAHDDVVSNVHAQNHFARGDVAQGLAEADVVIERTYRTGIVHQGYMEPCACVAEPDLATGGLTIYTSTQGQFMIRNEVARLLGLPRRKVRVVPMTVGGGFGAKYGIIEALVAATAQTLGQPVRMVLTRSEDFLTSTPSPASVIALKVGARRDGTLCAIDAQVTLDNGVFPFTLGSIVAILLGGYYKCPNVAIHCREVFTNKPQAGAYRAPGAPQATFALESTIDDLARELQLDPLQFRLQNAAETGDPMGNGDPWPSIGLRQVIARLQETPAWQQPALGPNEGIGVAVGGWLCGMSPAAAVCRVEEDGTVRVHVGSVDISGVNTSFVLVAAEILGVSPDAVEIVQGDTDNGPYAGPSGGSQTTYSVAGAVAAAAREARQRLLELAADEFEAAVDDLEIVDGSARVRGLPGRAIPIGDLAELAQNKAGGPGPILGQGRSAIEQNAPGFVAHLAHVAVDPDSGAVTLKQYVAVQDVGFALNPLLVEGQIHGGAAQGIGYGLFEGMVYGDDGQLLTASFLDYSLPSADKIPPIDVVMVENPAPHGPFGARGIGEPPITAGAAAIANAIRAATGVRVQETPIRAETLWRAIHNV
jgi:CO/xanthine dehydrogenase Mo-binding subunit